MTVKTIITEPDKLLRQVSFPVKKVGKKSKMELIAHRLNKIKELRKLPIKYGAEIDLRSRGSQIILSHDYNKRGEKLENYLSNYR